MYKDGVVKLVIGEFETTIEFKIGVKQGDSVAPVLFLFIVMAFAKTLEKEWNRRDTITLFESNFEIYCCIKFSYH